MKEMDMLGRRWGRVALKRSVGIQFVCSTLEGDFFIKSDFGSNFDTLCMIKRFIEVVIVTHCINDLKVFHNLRM